jgi:uncharacterized repeat protein (TIGR03843 family)
VCSVGNAAHSLRRVLSGCVDGCSAGLASTLSVPYTAGCARTGVSSATEWGYHMARSHKERHRSMRTPGRPDEAALLGASRELLLSPIEALPLLEQAEITGYQVVPSGTNYTFVVSMSLDGKEPFLGIYKPRRGENPLWDYPDGTLYRREHASYVTSTLLGWPNIPPTVIRDGPFGLGIVQLFVPPHDGQDFLDFRQRRSAELMEIALFDLLVNNGDRKAGHCIMGADGRIWAIDHGLTFNRSTRLRTVLWDYRGDPIPERLLADLRGLCDDPARRQRFRCVLEPDIDGEDVEAFFDRLERVLRSGKYPQLDPNRNLPWPLV